MAEECVPRRRERKDRLGVLAARRALDELHDIAQSILVG
jgi:hypothetical protein